MDDHVTIASGQVANKIHAVVLKTAKRHQWTSLPFSLYFMPRMTSGAR